MNDHHLALLLQLVKSDGDINFLLRKGLDYSQIAQMMLEIKQINLVESKDETLVLTDKGNAKLKELAGKIQSTSSPFIIEPLEEFRIEKMGKYDIYLPDRKKTHFGQG